MAVMGQRKVKFPKKERVRLEKALQAADEVIRRGYNCIPQAREVQRTIKELLDYDDMHSEPHVDTWNNCLRIW